MLLEYENKNKPLHVFCQCCLCAEMCTFASAEASPTATVRLIREDRIICNQFRVFYNGITEY